MSLCGESDLWIMNLLRSRWCRCSFCNDYGIFLSQASCAVWLWHVCLCMSVCVCVCFIWAQEHETCLWRPPVWQLSALKLHMARRSDWFYEPPSLCPASSGPPGCPTSCVCMCACTRICVCMCVFLHLKQTLAFKEPLFFIVNCPCLLIYATEEEISNLWLFICLFPFRFSLFFSIQLFFRFSLTAVFL